MRKLTVAFLQLRDVCKSYATPRGPHLVLQGIDLDVVEGEFIAIVGYSGSGKTTGTLLSSGCSFACSFAFSTWALSGLDLSLRAGQTVQN